MELNDTTDYQLCFACGQRNPSGLKMIFRLEEGSIVSDFRPLREHQGFPGVIHGGIVATILDEALNRTTMLTEHPAWTMTGRLEIRYRRYVPYGPLLRVKATLGKQRGRMIQASGMLTFADDEETVLADAQGSFMALNPALLDSIMPEYPGMRAFFTDQTDQKALQTED
jgi:acyl-coenzyme A thioesterase PaaI-like protein